MLVYFLVRFVIWNFSWWNFAIVNRASQILSWFLRNVLRYRRKVMEENLKNCIPQLSPSELNHTIRQSYLNLSDVLLESIKGLSMSEIRLADRTKIIRAEMVEEYLNRGQSVICVCGHYANWEWAVLSIGYRFKHKAIGIYKKINNRWVEDYIKKLRAKCTMKLLTTHETRFIQDEIPKGKLILLISDQNPSNIRDAIWVKFFGRDTACLHGLEKYATTYQLPVIYMEMKRTSRSNYQMEFAMLCEKPSELAKGELTQLFMSRLEKTIRENPSDWLWSHKRWKHQRQ
ncbi:MAG: lysophospholipid acyltransferase family protein [Saprospiraceae bacterium]|nr:lysophospholipid acyltransferase family protein [Saprospiraceae bacterium]